MDFSWNQLFVTLVEHLQKFVKLLSCCQMTEAHSPGGQRIFLVPADGKYRFGWRPLRGTGRLDGNTYAPLTQNTLKYRAFKPLNAEVEDRINLLSRLDTNMNHTLSVLTQTAGNTVACHLQ